MSELKETRDTQRFLDNINEIFATEFPGLAGGSPNYLYWDNEKGDQFFHTTKKVRDPRTDKMRFAAGIYRYFKDSKKYGKNVHALVKERYFATKWRAIEWAYKQYCKSVGQDYEPYTEAAQRRAHNKEGE